MVSYTIGSKIGGRFYDENFLRYLNLCYVNPRLSQIKRIALLMVVNQIKASRECFHKIYHPWGKGYFAAIGTNALDNRNRHEENIKGKKSIICILRTYYSRLRHHFISQSEATFHKRLACHLILVLLMKK